MEIYRAPARPFVGSFAIIDPAPTTLLFRVVPAIAIPIQFLFVAAILFASTLAPASVRLAIKARRLRALVAQILTNAVLRA